MNSIKEIETLIDRQSVSFISSIDKEGFPNTKAMLAPRKREGLKVFYFTTNTSSMRVSQYKENSNACIYFCAPQCFRGIMFTGIMEVLEDRANKEMIWRDGDTMYYSQGVTDPDYCVLKFTANAGRVYGNFRSENINL